MGYRKERIQLHVIVRVKLKSFVIWLATLLVLLTYNYYHNSEGVLHKFWISVEFGSRSMFQVDFFCCLNVSLFIFTEILNSSQIG